MSRAYQAWFDLCAVRRAVLLRNNDDTNIFTVIIIRRTVLKEKSKEGTQLLGMYLAVEMNTCSALVPCCILIHHKAGAYVSILSYLSSCIVLSKNIMSCRAGPLTNVRILSPIIPII